MVKPGPESDGGESFHGVREGCGEKLTIASELMPMLKGNKPGKILLATGEASYVSLSLTPIPFSVDKVLLQAGLTFPSPSSFNKQGLTFPSPFSFNTRALAGTGTRWSKMVLVRRLR
jgi:hypothetical protein